MVVKHVSALGTSLFHIYNTEQCNDKYLCVGGIQAVGFVVI